MPIKAGLISHGRLLAGFTGTLRRRASTRRLGDLPMTRSASTASRGISLDAPAYHPSGKFIPQVGVQENPRPRQAFQPKADLNLHQWIAEIDGIRSIYITWRNAGTSYAKNSSNGMLFFIQYYNYSTAISDASICIVFFELISRSFRLKACSSMDSKAASISNFASANSTSVALLEKLFS